MKENITKDLILEGIIIEEDIVLVHIRPVSVHYQNRLVIVQNLPNPKIFIAEMKTKRNTLNTLQIRISLQILINKVNFNTSIFSNIVLCS